MFFSGIIVVFLEILAIGPHIHEENGAIQIAGGVLLCNNGLFYGVHTADRRAVTVVAPVDVPGPHALEPRDSIGLLVVRQPHKMPHCGTGGGEDSFKFQRGNDVWMGGIVIGLKIP